MDSLSLEATMNITELDENEQFYKDNLDFRNHHTWNFCCSNVACDPDTLYCFKCSALRIRNHLHSLSDEHCFKI